MAAQLTTISRHPNCSSTARTVLKTASALLTSQRSALLLTSCASSSLPICSAATSFTSTQATTQPARAKARAVASPRPLPALVTSTMLSRYASSSSVWSEIITSKSVKVCPSRLVSTTASPVLRPYVGIRTSMSTWIASPSRWPIKH